MLWTPLKGKLRRQHNLGSVGTGTPGTSVTAGGASNTKGTPAEIFSATSFDACWVNIYASNHAANATASQAAFDLLIGAATESVLIANLLAGNAGSGVVGNAPKIWQFPLYIPAGSRIAVQAASIRTAVAMRIWVELIGGNISPGHRVGGKVTTYGMGTVPNGTAIVPGASGAEGSWAQMTASSTYDHFAFVPSFQNSGDNTTQAIRMYALDLGIGAAAAEQQIHEGWQYQNDAIEAMGGPSNAYPCFEDVPAGTRLSMRASNNGTNAGSYDGVLHAVS